MIADAADADDRHSAARRYAPLLAAHRCIALTRSLHFKADISEHYFRLRGCFREIRAARTSNFDNCYR